MIEYKKFKLKGNESFNIREGWLSKGLRFVEDGQISVFTKDDAILRLGIGSNMVKALRFWMQTTGLSTENISGRRIQTLTKLGQLVLENDRYIERLNTMWLLHYNIATNHELATVWHLFFNKLESKVFSREDLFAELQLIFKSIYINYPTEKSLKDDCNNLIKFYFHDEELGDPEDNLVCPFVTLGLIKNSGKKIFEKISPTRDKLESLIVFYGIVKALELNNMNQIKDGKIGINIDELFGIDASPVKVFNLTRNRLNEYLDEIKRLGFIEINRAAGLNMIYIDEKYSSNVIMEKCFIDR